MQHARIDTSAAALSAGPVCGPARGTRYALIAFLLVAGCSESRPDVPEHDPGTTGAATSHPDDGAVANESPEFAPNTAIRFVELAESAGLHFQHRNGQEAGHHSILESLGGGVALFDYDGDGHIDVFLPGGGAFGSGREIQGLPPALFRNRGDANLTEVTQSARIARSPYYSHGVSVADYNDDGFPDLLVTGYGGLLLFRNQGDGTFAEVARTAGLTDPATPHWSTSAAWGDVTGDGWLDLYVAHYVNWSFDHHPRCPRDRNQPRDVCAPKHFSPLPDTFYAGNGDGTFRNASSEVGLRKDGKGLGVLMADLDLDGDLDIYVANDAEPNFLYRNTGRGQLEESGALSGTALSDKGVAEGSMGVGLADLNNDGRPDLWVTNYERQNIALYRNEGRCSFQHVSQMSGVTAVGPFYVGWGTALFDFDRDGDVDAFVSNGHVERHPANSSVRQPPLLFENGGGDWFENVAPSAGEYLAQPHMGRGVAAGDLDRDGRWDLVVSHINEPAAMLLNRTDNQNHWTILRLIGTRSNRAAIGAHVRVTTADRQQTRLVAGGGSYASAHDQRLYFGLNREDRLEAVEIRWPSGIRQVLTSLPVDRIVTVIESASGDTVHFDRAEVVE